MSWDNTGRAHLALDEETIKRHVQKWLKSQGYEIVKEAFLEFLPAFSVCPIDVNELLDAIDTCNEVLREYDPAVLPGIQKSVYEDFYYRIAPGRLSYDVGYGNRASDLFTMMDGEALYRGDYKWWQVSD